MKVMIQTSLDGCPEHCRNLDLDYDADEISPTIDGTRLGVMVQVDCRHCDVCKIREKEPDGTIREVC